MPTDEELASKLLNGSCIISETKGKRRRYVWGHPKPGSADEQEELRALARTLRDLARTLRNDPDWQQCIDTRWPILCGLADRLDPDVEGRKLVFKKPRKNEPKNSFSDFLILATIYRHTWENGSKINEAKRATMAQLSVGPATVKRIWTNKRKIAKAAHVRFED